MREPMPGVCDLTYGVEVECYQPLRICRVGDYHYPYTIEVLFLNHKIHWGAERDASLTKLPHPDYEPVEYTSEVLQSELGTIKSLRENWLKPNKICVNQTCGFHVHVGWYNDSIKTLQKLVWIVANLEDGLWAMTGSTWRRTNGSSASSIKELGRNEKHLWRNDSIYGLRDNTWFLERHKVLNIRNLIEDRIRTVEFRLWPGTIFFDKMALFVQLSLGITQLAYKFVTRPKWDRVEDLYILDNERQKRGYWVREAKRVLNILGWTGESRYALGFLWDYNAPKLEEQVALALKLAEEFDYHYSRGRMNHISEQNTPSSWNVIE